MKKLILILLYCIVSEAKKYTNTKFHTKSHGEEHTETKAQVSKFEPLPPTFSGSSKTPMDSFIDFLSGRGMTKGEIMQVFRTLDKNFDGEVSSAEYSEFYQYFIQPYERDCKPNQFYQIDDENFNSCFCHSSSFKEIRGMLSVGEDDPECVLAAKGISQVLYQRVNLADYVILQRAQTAWNRCADGDSIGRIKIACALQIAVPGHKIVNYDEVAPLFDAAISMVRGRLKKPIFLDFPGFIHFAKMYAALYEIQRPVFKGGVSYSEFMRALDRKYFELNLTLQQIKRLFELFPDKIMSNSAFLILIHSAKVFDFYDTDDSRGLNELEFLAMFEDPNFDKLVSHDISQVLNISLVEENSSEGSSSGKESFILNFLQTGKKMHHRNLKRVQSSKKANLQQPATDLIYYNRKLMYSIFDVYGNNKMDLIHFLQFKRVTWIFAWSDFNQNGYIDGKEIRNALQTYQPFIPYDEEATTAMNEAMLLTSHYYSINIKEFSILFTYREMFNQWLIQYRTTLVYENTVKAILKRLGIMATDRMISSSKENMSGSGKNTFNYIFLIRNILSEEIKKVNVVRLEEMSSVPMSIYF